MSIMTGRSSQERIWLLAGGLGAFVLLVVGYLLLIGPQRSQTSSVNAQADSVRTQNAALQARIQQLQVQSKNMGKYQAQLVAADAALPSTSGVPAFLRSLQRLGSLTNTDAVNVTVGTPTDLSLAPAAAPTTTTSPTPSPTTSAVTDGTTTTPTTTTSGVYGLPITAQITGSDTALNRFLQQLQEVQPRAVLITQLTEGSSTTGTAGSTQTGNSLQLTMQAFVSPTDTGESAALASAAGGS